MLTQLGGVPGVTGSNSSKDKTHVSAQTLCLLPMDLKGAVQILCKAFIEAP